MGWFKDLCSARGCQNALKTTDCSDAILSRGQWLTAYNMKWLPTYKYLILSCRVILTKYVIA